MKEKLVSFDYSQIELRLAEISGDKNFIQHLKIEDIHAATAKEIFDLKDSEINSDYRKKLKQ